MTNALIGYTGFVGGNLRAARKFDALYNSSNVADAAGRAFDEVVFSAAKAEKWRINQEPERDAAHIAELEGILSSFEARRLVLISTVDVYRDPVAVDEATVPETEGLHAYGLHRLQLEQFARERFDEVLIVRLPGLFGPGIKKNVIFDLLNDNNIDRIHPDGEFQYYDLTRLADDLDIARAAGLELVNLATEPVSTRRVATEVFGRDLTAPDGVSAGRYDMRTRHGEVWGRHDGYLASASEVVDAIDAFVQSERSR
ncbi:hypothetical protein ACI2K6_12975 [Microbacterium sp. NPDC006705]|uniref:hypothetical protein n=1 Tax=Microbacterium sp. NPDC006705 TaxID=3364181 RepID=UPI0038503AB2